MRRWLASGGTFLILFALALPAHAGLGDLFDEVLDDPIADLTAPLAPVVTSVPLAEDLVETVDVVTSPLVTVVDEVASPVVTVVDEVVVEPVTDLVEPATDTVEPVGDTVEPVGDTVEPVIDTVEPVGDTVVPVPTVEVPPTLTTALSAPGADSSPVRPALVGVAPVVQAAVVGSVDPDSVQRVLLASISNANFPLHDREGNQILVNRTPWLTALGAWLESGLSGLLDVLAIPARFLELLFRALTSAGSGLVAPAAILAALVVAGRRRLLPAS
ncbi:MAG TPA: hypothetical protein VJ935_11275 [Acidimicrobiia bacterium]|nr:hypothetical protein [Acidimicrobiia bacterium]